MKRKTYTVYNSAEVRHSEHGNDLIKNFVFGVCGCSEGWNMENFIEVELEKFVKLLEIKVLCALSGGVDSSVVAVLIHKAIGDQLTCIFVDHGLLRKGEAEGVMKTFSEGFHMNVIKVDAKERFMNKLKGVEDPEQNVKSSVTNSFTYLMMKLLS